MREPRSTTRSLTLPVTLPLLLALAGCAQFSDWLSGRHTAEAEPVTAAASDSVPYIDELFRLASGDPATQAEIVADARAAARLTPDPASRLRYALALATPGHGSSDPEAAQTLLRELLAQPELLTSTEKSLATIWLRDVETRLVLNAEASRMRAEATREADSENAAIAERVATVEAENQALRQALAEAEQKLEAITSIERSIREQSEEAGPEQ